MRRLAAPRDEWRSTPNVPSTTPSGRSSDSSTGPCSMWSSRYAAAFFQLRCARRARGRGRRRCSRERVRQRDAVARRERSRSSSWSRIEPAAADEPNSERPKRAPSSSAQLTSRTVSGGVAVCGDPPQHLDPGDDVEAAVEPAAVRHRVDVAADAAAPGPTRPGSVNHWFPASSISSVGARRGDLLAQPLPRPLPRLRPRDALRAVLVAGQLLQLARARQRSGPATGPSACELRTASEGASCRS